MDNFQNLLVTETYNILGAPHYTIAQASRLCGITRYRVSRWLRGYEYSYDIKGEKRYGEQSSIVERNLDDDSANVSFLELVDLLFVKRFLDKGYSLQKIRKVFDATRLHLKTPHFASARFYVFGTKTILDENISKGGKSFLALFSGGQRAFPEIVEPVGEKIDFEDITEYGLASRWHPRGKDGFIVVDPRVSFGQPTIIGTRITTDNIYDLYMGENKKTESVSSWFNLPGLKIDSAVAFEQSIHA